MDTIHTPNMTMESNPGAAAAPRKAKSGSAKALMALLLAAAVIFVLIRLFAGGGGPVGTWRYDHMVIDGVTYNDYDEDNAVFRFHRDGTMTVTEDGMTVSGTWHRESGNRYTMSYFFSGYEFTVSGNRLIIDEGDVVTYFRKA